MIRAPECKRAHALKRDIFSIITGYLDVILAKIYEIAKKIS